VREYFIQIVTFVGGALFGIAVPLLPESRQKKIAGSLAVLLIAISLVWIGYELADHEPLLQDDDSTGSSVPLLHDFYIPINSFANDDIRTIMPNFKVGRQELKGVVFDIPDGLNKVSSPCRTWFSDAPSEVIVPVNNVANPEIVYLLINSGRTFGYMGSKIGVVEINFADGTSLPFDLTLGDNIREWRYSKEGTVSVASNSDLVQVYRGLSSDHDLATLDRLKLTIPEIHRRQVLTSIVLRDTSEERQASADPCITIKARS
jgi:hypothetical protein